MWIICTECCNTLLYYKQNYQLNLHYHFIGYENTKWYHIIKFIEKSKLLNIISVIKISPEKFKDIKKDLEKIRRFSDRSSVMTNAINSVWQFCRGSWRKYVSTDIYLVIRFITALKCCVVSWTVHGVYYIQLLHFQKYATLELYKSSGNCVGSQDLG